MRRVQSAPNLQVSLKKSISQNNLRAKNKCTSTGKLPSLLYAEPLPIEIIQTISNEQGIASGICFEKYGTPTEVQKESEKDLAECLAIPISNDPGLGEIVQAELDDAVRRMQEQELARKRRIVVNWLNKNMPRCL